jgi:hypothetical protein
MPILSAVFNPLASFRLGLPCDERRDQRFAAVQGRPVADSRKDTFLN